MRNESPSLNYSMKLLRRSPDLFVQNTDLLIQTKQNDILIVLLTTKTAIFHGNKK